MSNTLTARVKLDISDAERKLAKLEKRINDITGTVNKVSNSQNKVNKSLDAVNNKLDKTEQKVKEVDNANKKAADSANKITKGYKNANSAVSVLTKNLRTLVSTYLGVMGAKAVLNTSDNITSAQNKLNYVNKGNEALTQEQMLKTYGAAQRSRGDYMGMLNNVSKTMTLASDAFDGNVDNAIRFQEIMSKAYTVGGASAAEQSSSMYQLVQALGSGILQGDELRSVREGAPIAYKEIEKFAQGVYKTEESLKELASQGKITSDIVVAAMMKAGDSIDKAFADTDTTFAQAFTNIKNMAVQAFTPVLEVLNDALNSDVGKAIINGIGKAFVVLAKAVLWVMDVLGSFFSWCYDNWYWLQWVVFTVVSAICIYLTTLAAKAVWAGIMMFWSFLTTMKPIYRIIILIGGAVAAIVWLANTTSSACEFICASLVVVALTLIAIGLIVGSTILMVLGVVALVLAAVLYLLMTHGEETMGYIFWFISVLVNICAGIVKFIAGCLYALSTIVYDVVAFAVNLTMAAAMGVGTIVQWIVAFIVNLVMGCVNSIIAVSHNCVAGVVNLTKGLFNVISAICKNIGIAFQNAWNGALSSFWTFIGDCVNGLDWLAKPLEKIAKLFGKDFDYSEFASGIKNKGKQYKQQEYVSISDAWSTGVNSIAYKDISDAWTSGWNTMEYANLGDMVSKGWNTMEFHSVTDAWSKGWSIGGDFINLDNAYNTGAGYGGKVQDWLNSKVSSLKDKVAGFDIGDITDLLGKAFGQFTASDNPADNLATTLIDPNDPSLALNTSDDPAKALKGINDGVGNISDNTGSIADTMDLSQEDLEYLRDVANMEWKKEFTTATVKVDMSNYNTVNGDGDLDGIVTRLADRLYEELDMVANGVYA